MKFSVKAIATGFFLMGAGACLDSVRGPLLPIFVKVLGISFQRASEFIVVGNIAALPMLLFQFPILNRYGERFAALMGGGFVVASLFIAHFVVNLPLFYVLGALIGCGVAGIGSLSNIYVMKGVPEQSRPRFLNGLHVMYGVGAMVGPLAAATALEANISWPWWLCATLLFFLPAMGGVLSQDKHVGDQTAPQSAKLSFPQFILLLGFAGYVGGEVVTSMWLVSYLVSHAGLEVGHASHYLTAFFATIAISRAACFLFLGDRKSTWVLWASLLFGLVFFALGLSGVYWAFALVGLVGPFFPIFLADIGTTFPKQWRSMTVWVVITIQVTLILNNYLVGQLDSLLGIRWAYFTPIPLFALCLGCLGYYFRWKKTQAVGV